MSHAIKRRKLQMGESVTYKIRVGGYLDEVWADRLANMKITIKMEEEMVSESELTGRVRDQAELLGVLNGLYEMRLPILSLEAVGFDEQL